MLKKLLLIVLLIVSSVTKAQYIPISEEAEISILTIGPGPELYDKFGHSSIRINDPTREFDIVYNYGTFDWTTPNFYLKFTRGKLLYQLSVAYYEPFFQSYVQQERWVKEQVLDLTLSEKKQLFNFLQNNAKQENREYKYDFFFDNCATRIRDVLTESFDNKVAFNVAYAENQSTFRQLIQENVHWNSWGSMGMDAAIGAITDRKATAWEYQYLPEYLYKAVATASTTNAGVNKPLVKETTTLYSSTTHDTQEATFFLSSPLFVFSVLAFIILLITFRDAKNNRRSRFLDGIIFTLTGIVGIILALLWFATDHTATANNYNVLWAFPLSVFFAFGISKRQPRAWLQKYVVFLLLALALLAIHWISGVQEFPITILPLLIALAIRYLYIVRFLKNK